MSTANKSSLPFTVQDDIEAKEKYAAQQRSITRSCSSRRIRLWLYTGISSITGNSDADSVHILPIYADKQDEFINIKTPSLKDEILGRIRDNQLIVFSKTYCPFSKKAKRILSLYNLKEPLEVVEVDLRDDDYQVKMALNAISGRATFPNIFLNGQTIGGADDLEELHETGQLASLLRENQLLLMMWGRRSSVSKLLSIQLLEPIVFIDSNLETSPVIRGTVNVNFQKSCIIEKLELDFNGILRTRWTQAEKTKENQQNIASSHLQLYPTAEQVASSPPLLLNSGSTRFSFEMPLPARIPETISCPQVNVEYTMRASLHYKKEGASQMLEEIKKQIILARLPDTGMIAGENCPATIESHKHFSNWCQYRITIDTKSAVLGSKLPLRIEIAPTAKELRLKQVFLQLVERRNVNLNQDSNSDRTSQSVHFLYPAKGSSLFLPNRPITENWQGSCLYQIPNDNTISHSTQKYSTFYVSHLLLVSLLISIPDSTNTNGRHTIRTISFQTQIDLLDSHVAQLGDCEFTKLPSYDCPISFEEIEALKRHGLDMEGPPAYEETVLAV
ncbi:hypothetical protein [Parasitella parasitica]|uniref:Uncharacterized protein n=1 Tax=Parasitella parasitica TaxID=35722 RepID=A0A0B7NSU9_9FUNG|nr:hypothetical protein [Parasitella parasitica]